MWIQELVAALVATGAYTFNSDLLASANAVVPSGPTTDGPYTSLRATGGSGPSWTHNRVGPAYQHPGCQVITTAKSFSVAYDRAYTTYNVLTAIRNQFIGFTWYRSITPLQEPNESLGLDDLGRSQIVFNLLGDKRPSTGGAVVPSLQTLVEDLGGNADSFVAPAVNDVYPSGTTYDKLVPNSWAVLLNADTMYAGTYVLEASGKMDIAGGYLTVGLFNLTDDPDTPIATVTFPLSELVGARQRSSAITFASGDKTYGVKMTTSSTLIAGAAWGCRIVRV